MKEWRDFLPKMVYMTKSQQKDFVFALLEALDFAYVEWQDEEPGTKKDTLFITYLSLQNIASHFVVLDTFDDEAHTLVKFKRKQARKSRLDYERGKYEGDD